MIVNDTGANIERYILKSLREYYPIRVDEIVLISSVQKAVREAQTDEIVDRIRHLRERGYIEEAKIKAPFATAETFRFKITSEGIEYLQSLEEKEIKLGVISPAEIESRLVETYDKIKHDMETISEGFEKNQRVLEKDMEQMRERISDHDQVIRTYFVRVIETFGVFVGIFAVVVVVMISITGGLEGGDMETNLLILIAVPIILVLTILSMLYGIKKLILETPK